VLLVIASNHDHGEIFPTHVNRTEQGHAVCTVVEIDNGKIKMSTQPADQLQRAAGIMSKMTNTAVFEERLSDRLFQLRIVREEKDDRCFHIASMTASLLRRSTTIAI
jgi:hypothetical protein